MVTSRRRQGAAGRASERGPDPKRRTVGPGAGAAELVAGGSAFDFGAWSSRGEGGGGEGGGINGVGASAVLEAANPANPGAPASERRLRGLGA